jgi:hypothetical protein
MIFWRIHSRSNGGSLAHEFNDSFLAVGLKPGTVRDPNAPVMNDRYRATNQVRGV